MNSQRKSPARPGRLLVKWKTVRAAAADGHLSAAADLRVLVAILDRMDDCFEAFPGYGTIAKDVGIDRRTATRSVNRLVEGGYIRKSRSDRRNSNTYRLIGPEVNPPTGESGDPSRVDLSQAVSVDSPPESGNLKPNHGKTGNKSGVARKTARQQPTYSNGCRIPADFPNDDALLWGTHAFPSVNQSEEAAKFRDHWLAKAGKDARKADWMATWRNWIRRTAKWQAERNPPAGSDDARRRVIEESKRLRAARNGGPA